MTISHKASKQSRDTRIRIEDSTVHIDGFYLALCRLAEESLLPELYSIFGREGTVRFIEIFGGMSIQCPSVSELEEAVRDVFIWSTIQKAGDDTRKIQEEVRFLANQYALHANTVYKIYRDMSDLIQHVLSQKELEQLKRSKAATSGIAQQAKEHNDKIEDYIWEDEDSDWDRQDLQLKTAAQLEPREGLGDATT